MLKYILFDLDGTLRPMDQMEFTRAYFAKLTQTMAPLGYDADCLMRAVWDGTAAMVKNDGSCSNETAFWRHFASVFGDRAQRDRAAFDAFYRNEFQEVAAVCGRNPAAAEAVACLQQAGYTVVLATNPIFPAVATESRIRWAGLQPEQFRLYTTYENTSFCKPNLAYYLDLTARLGCQPEECLMVGNDVDEDMVAAQTGMQVFLLTDCLINQKNADISVFDQGDFSALLRWIAARTEARNLESE